VADKKLQSAADNVPAPVAAEDSPDRAAKDEETPTRLVESVRSSGRTLLWARDGDAMSARIARDR
jgi:hypothetical protein